MIIRGRRLTFLLSLILSILPNCGGGGGGGASAPAPAPVLPVESAFLLQGLNFPSAMAVAPDGRLFFAELPTGNIRLVKNNALVSTPVVQVPIPVGGAEGIFGIAFDPNYTDNHFFYVFHAAPDPNRNRLVRFREQNDIGVEETILLDSLPNGGHNGGKLAFGRDGSLFVSTGDNDKPNLAQLSSSYSGKLLRLLPDGTAPADNPFGGSPVFAIGFRNIYGLAIHPQSGAVYVSDNGPECDDEIDKVVAGGNYGWRADQPCGDSDPAFMQPLVRINPALGVTGLTFYRGAEFPEYDGHMLLADFNTGAIRRYAIDDRKDIVTQEAIFFEGGAGSITDIVVDGAGVVYASTTDAIISFRRKPSSPGE